MKKTAVHSFIPVFLGFHSSGEVELGGPKMTSNWSREPDNYMQFLFLKSIIILKSMGPYGCSVEPAEDILKQEIMQTVNLISAGGNK